jgi:hypothetical protein
MDFPQPASIYLPPPTPPAHSPGALSPRIGAAPRTKRDKQRLHRFSVGLVPEGYCQLLKSQGSFFLGNQQILPEQGWNLPPGSYTHSQLSSHTL